MPTRSSHESKDGRKRTYAIRGHRLRFLFAVVENPGRIAASKIARALPFRKSPETPRQPVHPDRVSKLFFEHALESCDASACSARLGSAASVAGSPARRAPHRKEF